MENSLEICMALVVGFMTAFVLLLLSIRRSIDLERLDKEIKDKLIDEGYTLRKQDGDYYIKRKGQEYQVRVLPITDRNDGRMCVVYGLRSEALTEVSEIGKLVIMRAMNNDSFLVKSSVEGDTMTLSSFADVNTGTDFVHEFLSITDEMERIQKRFADTLDQLKADFPAQEPTKNTPMGFHATEA